VGRSLARLLCCALPCLSTVDCLSFPHVIHAIVSLTSGTVFFIVAVLLVSTASMMCSWGCKTFMGRPCCGAACMPSL